MNSTSLYAAIDLGSNSFHMLVVREAAGSIQTLTRIKRKVRLAAESEQRQPPFSRSDGTRLAMPASVC